MKSITLLLSLLITSSLLAQRVTFSVSDTHISQFGMNSDLVSFVPLFKLESSIIHNKEISIPYIKLPKSLDKSQTAYGFLSFTGIANSAFINEVTILVENYLASSPIIYIDRNGNLDFSDDGSPIILEEKYRLSLYNQNNPSANYNYNISRSKVSEKNELRLRNRYSRIYPKSTIIPASHWITQERLSIRVHRDILNEKHITILLADNSVDGIFTFEPGRSGDRILIVEGDIDINDDLTSLLRQGEPIDHNTVFELYGIKYFIESVSESGDEVTISETDKNTRVIYEEGMDISSFSIELLDGTSKTIKELTKGKDYLLIDVGGTWCAGCIAQESTIKELYQRDSVEVIGLFDHDTPESVNSYAQKHNLEWDVALVSPAFRELFRVNYFPTYILVSSEGKFLFADRNSEQIVKYLNIHN